MKSIAALLLTFTLSATGADKAVEHRSIDYGEINEMLHLFKHKIRSPYVYYRSYLNLKDESIDPTSIKIWLTENDTTLQDIAISFNRESGEHLIELPWFEQDKADNIKLNINQTKDAVGLSISSGINPPTEASVKYNNLMVMLDDINEFASEMAGAMSWFVPDMDQIKFVFDEPSTITLTAANFEKIFTTDDEFVIVLERTKKLTKSNPLVKFSSTPNAMIPED